MALWLVCILLFSASTVTSQELHRYVPGFVVNTLYTPENCSYRAQDGDRIYVHFNGSLEDGSIFSQANGDDTYDFRLGLGDVVEGMDWGMQGVCEGEKRSLVVPAEIGYGNNERRGIPAGSTITLDIEVVKIEKSGFQVELLYTPEKCRRRTAPGDFIREHYNGTFENGTIFDTSYQRGRTYDFVLGEGNVIRGVDMGLMNMCEGERRRLTLPASLAYGSRGYRDLIPGGATLIFDAEVVEIVSGKLKWYKIDGPECSEDEQVKRGDMVTMTYHGFYDAGYRFSSNGEERKIRIEDTTLMKGVVEGTLGMCIGEQRRLKINPELAVGDLHEEKLPQNSRLTVDVEIIDIEKSDLFKTIDKNGDKYLCEKEVENFLKKSEEFANRMKDNRKAEILIDFHFSKRDKNKDGWLNRQEFYNLPSGSRDEL